MHINIDYILIMSGPLADYYLSKAKQKMFGICKNFRSSINLIDRNLHFFFKPFTCQPLPPSNCTRLHAIMHTDTDV